MTIVPLKTISHWTEAGIAAPFDYGQLDEEDRAAVLGCRDEIERRLRRSFENMVAAGRALIEAKARLPHGQFGRWLEAEFAWSQQTANNLMNAARLDGKIPSDLEFGEAVIYALAAPSTPPEVVAEMVERTRAGQTIRPADVRAEVAARRSRAEAAERPAQTVRSIEASVTTTRHEIPVPRYAPDPADHTVPEGKVIDVTGYLRPERSAAKDTDADVVEGVVEIEISPEDQARIDRFERVHHAHARGEAPNARFWRTMNAVRLFLVDHLDPTDPNGDPARIVAAMGDGEELDEAEATAADFLRWAELLVAAIDERRSSGH